VRLRNLLKVLVDADTVRKMLRDHVHTLDVRILSDNVAQFLFSTELNVSPPEIVKSVKGVGHSPRDFCWSHEKGGWSGRSIYRKRDLVSMFGIKFEANRLGFKTITDAFERLIDRIGLDT